MAQVSYASPTFKWHSNLADPDLEKDFQAFHIQQTHYLVLGVIAVLLLIEALSFGVDIYTHQGAMINNQVLAARVLSIALGLFRGIYIYLRPTDNQWVRYLYIAGILAMFLWTMVGYTSSHFIFPISIICTSLVIYLLAPMTWLAKLVYNFFFVAIGMYLWSFTHPLDTEFFRIVVWLVFAQAAGALASNLEARNKRRLFVQDLHLQHKLKVEKQLMMRNDSIMSLLSHEVRTPLSTIGIQAELLLHPSVNAENDKIGRIGEYIFGNAQAVVKLLDSWLSSNQSINFSLNNQAASAQPTIAQAIEEINTSFPQAKVYNQVNTMRPVDFDNRVLLLAIKSLLSNAIQHGHSHQGVRVASHVTPKNVRITVRDWGQGMTNEQLKQLFARRSAAATQDANTGLNMGLHLLNNLVTSSDGKLEAYSQVATGTLIVLTLPLALPANTQPA